MNHVSYQDNVKLNKLITVICLLGLITEIIFLIKTPLGLQQAFFLVLFSGVTLALLSMRRAPFSVMFLLSTFSLITAWRLSALAGYTAVTWLFTAAMLLKLVSYCVFAYQAIKTTRSSPSHQHHHQSTVFEWQLLLIRLFIGFDLIPHFCEKLFAGSSIRLDDVHAFAQMGVPHPLMMVLIAGLMEFAGALAISCGLLTRLGSLCLVTYLLVATYLGHHFSHGFIWASPGGGWEFPMLWSALILSFVFFGAGDFSLDRALKNTYKIPTWLKHLMGGRFT